MQEVYILNHAKKIFLLENPLTALPQSAPRGIYPIYGYKFRPAWKATTTYGWIRHNWQLFPIYTGKFLKQYPYTIMPHFPELLKPRDFFVAFVKWAQLKHPWLLWGTSSSDLWLRLEYWTVEEISTDSRPFLSTAMSRKHCFEENAPSLPYDPSHCAKTLAWNISLPPS